MKAKSLLLNENKTRNYNKWISDRSKSRKPSAIRALQPLISRPGMISLAGGLPNPSTFPFESMTITLKSGQKLDIKGGDFQRALQYSSTPGFPELVSWAQKLQKKIHNPPIGDYSICFGVGSQDVLTKAFEAVLNPGDSLLVENPTYSGSLAFLKPLGVNFKPVETDSDGLCPDSLQRILENARGDKPKALYTIPTGGNPTGCSTSLERRKQVYQLAQKHDLLILEDDPYYYLQFSDNLLPSYFSMDTDGRVLRFDSLSKILSSGLRLGWVSGPPELVERIVLHSQATTLHPSGLSQAVMLSLINHWGADSFDAFLKHASAAAAFYKAKCTLFTKYAQKHLDSLASWNAPQAGMFVWLKMNNVSDSKELIYGGAQQQNVLLVPGFEFYALPTVTNYVRASFSTATEEQLDLGLERLARLLQNAK